MAVVEGLAAGLEGLEGALGGVFGLVLEEGEGLIGLYEGLAADSLEALLEVEVAEARFEFLGSLLGKTMTLWRVFEDDLCEDCLGSVEAWEVRASVLMAVLGWLSLEVGDLRLGMLRELVDTLAVWSKQGFGVGAWHEGMSTSWQEV